LISKFKGQQEKKLKKLGSIAFNFMDVAIEYVFGNLYTFNLKEELISNRLHIRSIEDLRNIVHNKEQREAFNKLETWITEKIPNSINYDVEEVLQF